MWGDRAYALIKELERCRDSVPAYNDDAIRVILEEMRILNQFIDDAMNTTFHPETNNFLPGVKARQAALERNKRCLLAYEWNRLQKLREMRWEFGSILPVDIKSNLSEIELSWFNGYSKCLANFMKSLGGQNGLNLMQDFQPPKDLYIEVRCLEDYGHFELESGEVLTLNKGSQHLLPRSQCESLIRQGILKQLDS